VIEIDAASHGGVDDARELRERAFYTPVSGRFKIYIIDEAHMVTQQGFNALLKLVEEPPPHLKFIFATTEPEKVLPTIRSRTHHYPFRLVPPSVLRELMQDILGKEGVAVEESVLPLVVRAGAGSVRDSLSILDQLLAGSDESGLSYERAVALLGFTDASLLDEIADAFAAADGAAVFRVVNRVIEGGHEPRRFAADLLDRLRDLIVLAAVPDAAASGLLDLPPDRAELMARQADRFGQAGLARAAEIVSTGLDQMRGATSPRLLLELTCAQVLLPTAATDEKALLARLERLEKGTSAAPRQVPQSPQRPPHSAPDDDAERARVPSPAARPAPESPERPQAASPPVRSAPEPPEPARPAPPPARAASAPPAAESSPTDSLRANWDAIVETVRQESRVAWALLRNANVLSLDDGVLTLRFPREGEMRAFSVSGHDGVLKRVLSNDFGLNATIKGVAGGDAQTGRPAPAAAVRPPAVRRDPAPVPSESAPPDFAGPESEGPEFAEPYDEPDDMPPGGSHEDEPSPDDRAVRNAELTGMDLIQRELGGQVIGEFEG
jgi:DNA polymerase-3 subunit gamma/tau